MKIPDPFVFDINGKTYQVSFEVDLYSLSFSFACPPSDFKDEVIRFFKDRPDETEITVRVLVLEKNKVTTTIDIVPLLVLIKPLQNNSVATIEDDDLQRDNRIFQFQQYIDELSTSGQLDYLYNDKE